MLLFLYFPIRQLNADLTLFVSPRFQNIQASEQTHFLPVFRGGAVLLRPAQPSSSPFASTTAGYSKVECAV